LNNKLFTCKTASYPFTCKTASYPNDSMPGLDRQKNVNKERNIIIHSPKML